MRTFLLALIPLSLLACTMEPDAIHIGSNRWLSHAPLCLADELQWTERAGLRQVEYLNASGVLRGFRNGLPNVALLTLDEVLTLQSSDLDLEIPLIIGFPTGTGTFYARPPALQRTDFGGRPVGVKLRQRLGLNARALPDTLDGPVMIDAILDRQMLRDGRLPGSIEHLNHYMAENRLPSRPARAPKLLASHRGRRC